MNYDFLNSNITFYVVIVGPVGGEGGRCDPVSPPLR